MSSAPRGIVSKTSPQTTLPAKMLADEALVRELLAGSPAGISAIYIAVVGGILGLAWLRNRRAAVRSQLEAVQ